ncbi:hypothetical protein D3OALGA1CA_1775 [Olavius algarvensis associated proteobacterium Delta 3]|nr:hypothetical protein D3OALGA1CA_1775 [Olavius algarvensis associated proteobacterium Delta 3]
MRALDNAANGFLRERPAGETFSKFYKSMAGYKMLSRFYRKSISQSTEFSIITNY